MRDFVRQTGASSAVEFALLAPVIVLMTTSTFDLGSSISQRMALDGVVRNGVQTAMEDGSIEQILSSMQAAADTSFGDDETELSAVQICSCGTAEGAQVSCETTCDAGAPNMYIALSAQLASESMMIPSLTLAPTVYVQTR
ncbi:MAG: pilus assembly protein [Thalassovita sp.]